MFFNKINIKIHIILFIILNIILIYFKIKPYDFNPTSMIGIWEGFLKLNPDYIDKGFIIFKDGGYDGQFFYLLSKYLYTSIDNLPILDSFTIRFNRIGLSIITGFITKIFSFNFYPQITYTILITFHIISFYLLQCILENNNKYLSYYYLYSPFAINSNLLLVADSLSVSIATILIAFIFNYKKMDQFLKYNYKKYLIFFSIFIFSILTPLIKEIGLIIIFSLLLMSILEKHYKLSFLFILSLLTYIFFSIYVKFVLMDHLGTNPLGFTDLIDYPLFGFYKSIHISNHENIKGYIRELIKFPIFIYYILLIFNLYNIRTMKNFIISIPLLFIIITAGIGEQGYWLSYDNITRMFTISILWVILLKNQVTNYKDFQILNFGLIFLFFTILRILWIKQPMEYFIFK